MHDIWNPWHGCIKISEGCENCYMYFLDSMRDGNGRNIYRVKNDFDKPLQQDRHGDYKIKSGETVRICMTSDFFLEEADGWRDEVWDIIRMRPDVKFYILTKRINRAEKCLPSDWGDGWENVMMNVSAENDRRAKERIPVLLSLPFKHKGIMCAPFIGEADIENYLATGQIEQVICGGENYSGCRPCRWEWVVSLSEQCRRQNVSFTFIETGTKFIKNNRLYTLKNKRIQSEMAYRSGISFKGREHEYILTDRFGVRIPKEELYTPFFGESCTFCGSRPICNGCSFCGKCR